MIKFQKMHGFGNDFLIIDWRKVDTTRTLTRDEIIYMVDRNFGIGCDQILVLYPSATPDDAKGVNLKLKIYNRDATEALNCGNGIMCIVGYISRETTKPLIRIEVGERKVLGRADKAKFTAKINMGVPVVNEDIVKIGNKHKIILIKSFNEIDSKPNDEYNISYVKIMSRQKIIVRTVERGSGETLSCGSGVCSSVAYCIQNDLVEKNVQVVTRGSDIMDSFYDVSWEGNQKPMLMNGGYSFVFNGEIAL